MSTATAPGAGLAALLVDADNVRASVIERALTYLAHHGLEAGLRRAYGGHGKLVELRDCLLRHGFRAIANHGNGTTDALLVVDAMDLLHAGRLPRVVAIASSDADFAPLALRLREAGLRVLCFAQKSKAADSDLGRAYDDVLYLDEEPAPAPAPAKAAAKKSTRTAAKKSGRTTAKAKPPAPSDSHGYEEADFLPSEALPPHDPVRDVLEAMPGFLEGESLDLGEAAKRLRQAKLLGKSASVASFLRKNAPFVELLPAKSPNTLRFVDDDEIPF